MKKSFIALSLVITLLTATQTFAATESSSNSKQSAQELRKALWQRYVLYRKNKQRNTANNNRIAQQMQHKISRAEKNVTERSTISQRTGDLRFVPYYGKRRGISKLSSAAPNTAKRNFKVRAFDYFVEGGEAGRKVLTENTIKSRDHKVSVRTNGSDNPTIKNVASIIKIMRARQKYRAQFSDAPSGYQESTGRTGAWRRNLVHPYMFKSEK